MSYYLTSQILSLSLFLLNVSGSSINYVAVGEMKTTDTSETTNSSNVETMNPVLNQTAERLRQDEEDAAGGLPEAPEVPETVNAIGVQNVGNIINGVLSGNFANIFKGAAGFIEEDDIRQGVGGILNGFTNPLTQLLGSSLNRTKEYFGFAPTSTPAPKIVYIEVTSLPKVGEVPLQGLESNLTNVAKIVETEGPKINLPGISVQRQTTPKISDDDEDEADSQAEPETN